MLRAFLAGLLVATTGCSKGQSLPDSVIGEWDQTFAGCADPESLNGVTITTRRIQFYESGGDIRDIVKHSNGALAVLTDWSDVNVVDADVLPRVSSRAVFLAPSANGSSLTINLDGATWRFVRCPGG